MRTPGHQAEACPSSESIKRSACDAPHAKTDPAVARAQARRSPETCRTRAGDEHSPNGPRKCVALNAAEASCCLEVQTRPHGRRCCGSFSSPPASRLRKTNVSTFGKAIGVQEAYKAGLAAGRKGGSGTCALRSRGSPSRHLELLVACRLRLRAHLDGTPCRS